MRSVLALAATTALFACTMTGPAAASEPSGNGGFAVGAPADPVPPLPPILQQPPADEGTPADQSPGDPADPAAPGTEPPGTETPGAETPGTEAPGTETPGTEAPGTETPGTETPGTETPGTETPGTETPGGETPGAETPGAETPDAHGVPPQAEPVVVPVVKPGAGTPLLGKGSTGKRVRQLQVRLQRVGSYDFPVTGEYGKRTVTAVKAFQKKVRFVRSGAVDAATQKELVARAGKVRGIDIAAGENRPYGSRPAASCMVGNVVCVDSTAKTVRWIENGRVRLTLDARFGGRATPTRTGVFSIYYKSRDHVSRLYGSAMPFAMFFSGGQAVHYSSDFASRGYYGSSHGCINTRQFKRMAKLYAMARVGDRVVVYQSRPIKG